MIEKCSVDGCQKQAKARGFCDMHYYRFRKYGDPNLVAFARAIEGEPQKFIDALEATGEGCIKWPFSSNNAGYGQINIGLGKKSPVSRVVCERFNGPAPSDAHHAAHSCGKGHLGCVAPWHLAWKTPKENSADMILHGTRMSGQRNPRAKLTEDDVRYIRQASGLVSHAEIARKLGVSQAAVSNAARGASWATADIPAAKHRSKIPASGFRGVRLMRSRWQARTFISGKIICLGTFDTPELARAAIDAVQNSSHPASPTT